MDDINDTLIQLDVKNKKDTYDFEGFYTDMFFLLKRMVRGRVVKNFVTEKPVPYKGGRYSSDKLLELLGRVKEWRKQIPELAEAHMGNVLPQTWRSLALPKKTNLKSKVAIARGIVDQHPLLEFYYNTYPYSDYDSFEAGGIIEGYLKYAYAEDGTPQICGSKEMRHTSIIGYKYVPVSEIQGTSTLAGYLGEAYPKVFSLVYKAYNKNYNKHDNIRMASSNYDCLVTVLPDDLIMPVRWKYNFDIKPDYVLLAYIIRKNSYTDVAIRWFQYLFPMNEEVYSE
jgi:hypothetical protein